MKPKHQRLLGISIGGACLGLALFLVLNAFDDNLVFFYSPTDLKIKNISSNQRIRIGGLVQESSLVHGDEVISFTVTDHENIITVNYSGLLPDLFREGQGIVAEGQLISPTHFEATSVLAKHDENYMPPEVQKSLKEQGLWRHDQ